MKKILLSLAVIAMAAGCSMVDEGGVPSGKNIIRVTSDEGTRTEIVTDDDVNFRHNWVEGDAIALFDAKDILKYELVGEGGSTVADFAGDAPVKQKAPYYAFYPYKDNIDIYNDATNQSKFLYNFPNEVEYDGGVMAGSNVMIGFTDEKNLSMKNACAYIRVSLSAQDLSFLDEIEIIANGGEFIAGPHLVGIDPDGVPFTEPCYEKEAGTTGADSERSYLSNVLKVKFPESKFIYANSSVFYIPVPAVDLSEGLSFNLYGNFSGDSEINLTSSTATLERNNVLVMPDYRITINYALLTDGETFNVALKKMVNDTVTLTGTVDKIIKKVTFKVNEDLTDVEGVDLSAFGDGSIIATLEEGDEIVIRTANPDIRTNPNAGYMFAKMYELEAVEGWDLVDTKMSTTLRNMFWNARKLKDIDLSKMETKNVTSMWSLFCNMYEFDDTHYAAVKTWNTGNVQNFNYMFGGTKITDADLSSLDMSSAVSLASLFEGCANIKTADWSSYYLPNVTNINSMFYKCSSLESFDLRSIPSGQVTNFNYLFGYCTSLKDIDLSYFNFNNHSSKSWYEMFRGCSNLETVDMSAPGWDIRSENLYNLFDGCVKLKVWKVGKDATFSNLGYHSYAWRNMSTNATTSDPVIFYMPAAAAQSILKAGNAGPVRTKLKDGVLKFISINDMTTPLKIFKNGTEVEQNANGGYDVTSGYSKVTVTDPAL